ncbi:MAG TPA: hypothetical protein VH352_11185 [Pseudonocardiaceae bacterium]|nr:hypothetical protein [Pseudonocardiaceae bacterium]
MEYQLTAEVIPPATTPALDALQRHGVAALLDEHLDLLAEIEGPDGVEIEPVDHRVSVEPNGASINWVLDAPALVFAEDAARQVLGELLERTELLTDWSVRRCEVTASDEDLAAALAGAASDDDADETVEIEIDLDDLDELGILTGIGEPTDEDRAAKREQLIEAAEALGAFGLEALGHDEDDPDCEVSDEAAVLVAGALVQGLELLTEELFIDVQTLEDAGTSASEQEVLWVLHDLPTRYAGHYTALFAKKFLIMMAVLGYRLALPEWDGPLNTAEVLAINLMKSAARNQLELAGLADELPLDEMFEVFDEYAFEDLDVSGLYADADADELDDEDDIDELVLVEWFEPVAELDDDTDDTDDTEDSDESDESVESGSLASVEQA